MGKQLTQNWRCQPEGWMSTVWWVGKDSGCLLRFLFTCWSLADPPLQNGACELKSASSVTIMMCIKSSLVNLKMDLPPRCPTTITVWTLCELPPPRGCHAGITTASRCSDHLDTCWMTYLLLVDGNPVSGCKPLMILNVIDTILQVAIALGQVYLQQVAQQVLQVWAEVGWEADLNKTAQHRC